MDILGMLESAGSGSATVKDNPKAAFLKAVEAQRKTPSWVSADKNTISVRPGNRIFFPEGSGKGAKNKVIKGSSQGVDYTDPAVYGSFLDGLRDSCQSGALDAHIKDWASRF